MTREEKNYFTARVDEAFSLLKERANKIDRARAEAACREAERRMGVEAILKDIDAIRKERAELEARLEVLKSEKRRILGSNENRPPCYAGSKLYRPEKGTNAYEVYASLLPPSLLDAVKAEKTALLDRVLLGTADFNVLETFLKVVDVIDRTFTEIETAEGVQKVLDN